MKREISSGFITFTIRDGKIHYLLLKHPSHWSFPKGHLEEGEDPLKAAIRELKEETGIERFKIIDGFRERISYTFSRNGDTVYKEVFYFLAEVPSDVEVKISGEHSAYGWFTYREAIMSLRFDNIKEVLRKAHRFISENYGL